MTPGQSFMLNVTVRNRGDGPAGSTTLRYYRSPGATISRSDIELGTGAVTGLPASGAEYAWIRLQAPSSAGTYYYGACVESVPGESDTQNNCSTAVSTRVGTAPPPTTKASKLYWTDAGASRIQRANLDGSNVQDLVTGLGIPYGLALDAADGKMYWADTGTDRIQRPTGHHSTKLPHAG